MTRFPMWRRCGAARHALALALATACAAMPVHAARPMITDDARVVDARACQLESWVHAGHDRTEYWALPACNFSGNLELTLGGARSREGGTSRTTDLVMQGKTLFKPLDTNGWGIGLAAGIDRHPGADAAGHDAYAYVPASFSFQDDAVVLHSNLGWLRPGDTRRDHATWGLGTEVRLAPDTWLIAETFGRDGDSPAHQLGLRHWLVTDRIQIDATYGDHSGGGGRWFSIGLRLLSLPFLP